MPGGKEGAERGAGARAAMPGRNWKGESLMASCNELGGRRKGGKPSGMPGGNESRDLVPAASWLSRGSGTSGLPALRRLFSVSNSLNGSSVSLNQMNECLLFKHFYRNHQNTYSGLVSVLYFAARLRMKSL